MKHILLIVVLAVTLPFFAQASELTINFSPEKETFAEAVKHYQSIWINEGQRIVQVMEDVSGLKFTEKNIQATICECVSMAGSKGRPMKLRASYPPSAKQGVLIHELGLD
jgi:hypothetical protein